MMAVQLVKCDTDTCKHCRVSDLVERSALAWLQPDWIGSCEESFLEDGGLDRTMLTFARELLGGFYELDLDRVADTAWWRGRISS